MDWISASLNVSPTKQIFKCFSCGAGGGVFQFLMLYDKVTFPEAVLGAEIKVPTVEGRPVTVKLAAGTTNGRVLRVRGKGATRRDGSRGDLLVTIDVAVPAKISGKAKEALEAYKAATTGENPRAHLVSEES